MSALNQHAADLRSPSAPAAALARAFEITPRLGGEFERFLIRSAGAFSIASSRSPEPSPTAGTPVNAGLLSRKSVAWIEACFEAQESLELCQGRPSQRPVPIALTHASIFGDAAARWAKPLLKAGVSSAIIADIALEIIGYYAPTSWHPALEMMAPKQAIDRWQDKLNTLSDGPHAPNVTRAFSPQPGAWNQPLELSEPGPRVTLPQLSTTDDELHAEYLQRRGWSLRDTRVFIALHESAHATHALQSPTLSALFGEHLSPGPASLSLSRLIWPAPSAKEPNAFHHNARLADAFERMCKNVLMEGYADCYASFAMGKGEPAKIARIAADFASLRGALIPCSFEGFLTTKSDMEHDTREALSELSRRCDEQSSGSFALPEGGLHELSLSCAVAGLSRWICHLSTLPERLPVVAGFHNKLALWAAIEPLSSRASKPQAAAPPEPAPESPMAYANLEEAALAGVKDTFKARDQLFERDKERARPAPSSSADPIEQALDRFAQTARLLHDREDGALFYWSGDDKAEGNIERGRLFLAPLLAAYGPPREAFLGERLPPGPKLSTAARIASALGCFRSGKNAPPQKSVPSQPGVDPLTPKGSAPARAAKP